jgi:hypothetical protein
MRQTYDEQKKVQEKKTTKERRHVTNVTALHLLIIKSHFSKFHLSHIAGSLSESLLKFTRSFPNFAENSVENLELRSSYTWQRLTCLLSHRTI